MQATEGTFYVYNNKYIISAYVHTDTHIHVYTYIHTRTHKQRILFLRIVLTPGGPRGPLWRLWSYLLYTTPPRTLESTAGSRVVFEPPWWPSEKFYATVTSTNSHFVLFFSVPFYVPVCKSRIFLYWLILPPRSSLLYRGRRRDYKRNYTKRWTSEHLWAR